MNEITVYCLHIPQEEFGKIFKNEKVIEVAKKTEAAITEVPKNPLEYCASLAFRSPKNRTVFAKALKKMGIRFEYEILPARVFEGEKK